jgi:hypothetical protein
MPTLDCPNQFAFCKSFDCDVIAAAMENGFLPMACSLDRPAFGGMRHVLLAKMHHQRCVMDLTGLKVRIARHARPLMKPADLCADRKQYEKARQKVHVFAGAGLSWGCVWLSCAAW